MRFDTQKIKLKDLNLDLNNYRILYDLGTEQQIVDYFFKNEDLAILLKAIEKNGIIPGERIIILNEDGKNIVYEGNRRVAAMKILLGLLNVPDKYGYLIENISNEVKEEISEFNCDVIVNKEDANILLIKRHIEGPKKWKTLSKLKNLYELVKTSEGLDLDDLAISYDIQKSKLKQSLKNYQLYILALNSFNWTNDEIAILTDPKIKLDPYVRLFNAKSKEYETSLFELLKMNFDDRNLQISTSLDKSKVNKIIKIAVDKTLIEKSITTRNHIEDIPEITSLLGINKQRSIYDLEPALEVDRTENKELIQVKEVETKERTINQPKNITTKRRSLIPINYILISEYLKVNYIIDDLKRLDIDSNKVTCSIVLRSLLEFAAKSYKINKMGAVKDDLTSDVNLVSLILAVANDMQQTLKIDKGEYAKIKILFDGNKSKYVTIFNSYVHNIDTIPDVRDLISIFDAMQNFIKECFN